MKKRIIKLFLLIILLIPFNIKAEVLPLASENVMFVNLNNNEVVYSKNEKQLINVASMQKVMTTIVAIENITNYDETVTIEPGMFNGMDPDLLMLGLYAGETVTYNDLLHATMIRSAADAAYSLGYFISGSEEAFVELMNKKAKELGMNNTVFKNTTGLDEDGQHSTVEDIYILFRYALQNQKFKEVVSTVEYTTSDGEFKFDGPIATAKNLDLKILGGKTGYTEGAGLCLVSYSSCNGIDYILVTANADYHLEYQNYFDQKTIYDFYMNNYNFNTIFKKGDLITKIKTMYDDEVEITAPRDVTLYVNNAITSDDLDIEYEGETNLKRGVKQGDKIGKYTIKYDGVVLYEEDILSPITVTFKIKTVFIVALLVIVGSIIIHLFFRSRRRKKRRSR